MQFPPAYQNNLHYFLGLQKHHYHELSAEMQSKLGALPNEFTSYWIDRFPRVLSHSYHALQKYSTEHSFHSYYAKEFVFSKPQYFYELTEDFVPTEPSKYQRDSPKKYVKDYRYKHTDNGNSGGGSTSKQFSKPFGSGDINNTNYTKPNKKGSYNFHRNSITIAGDTPTTTPTIPAEPIVDADGFIRVRSKSNNNTNFKKPIDNIRWTMPNRDDNWPLIGWRWCCSPIIILSIECFVSSVCKVLRVVFTSDIENIDARHIQGNEIKSEANSSEFFWCHCACFVQIAVGTCICKCFTVCW